MSLRKPSVLVFEASDNWGGIEAFIGNEIAPLQDEFDIFVVTQNENPRIRERIGLPTDHYITVSERYGSPAYRKHLRSLFARGFDIVHVNKNSLIKYLPITLAKRVSTSKVIIHSHNTSPSSNSSLAFLHYLTRPFITPKGDVLVACSEVAAEYMFGRKDKNAEIITNGINTETFRFDSNRRIAVREELSIADDDAVFINVGRFSSQKNQMFLLDAFAVYHKTQPHSRLLLVGDGETRKQIKECVKSHGLNDFVILTGRRSDISALYSAADVAVVPSLFEGLPVSLVEAQASGIRILASDTITREINLTGQMVFKSLRDGPQQWAETMAGMADSVDTYEARANGADIVRESGYDQADSRGKLEGVYWSLTR